MTLTGVRVMVVEDEALVSMMIEEFLTDLGCIVVAIASRLEDALQKAKTMTVDVVMLDLNLAGQLSYPVAETLRSRGIPFFFATGYGRVGAPELLGSQVLSKPFNQKQLATALLVATAG